MATQFITKSSPEERLICRTLVATYPIYFLGALYVTGSVIGWVALLLVMLKAYLTEKNPKFVIPVMVWIWVFAMFFMLVVLWIGHSDWYLGQGKTIKSSIGWAKGWALFPVFLIIGCVAQIRVSAIVRAVAIISTHSLWFAIFTILANAIGAPGEIYVSPLKIVGGPGPGFFTVSLYGLNPETGAARWQFFGPWSPAAGLLACLFFVICCAEPDKRWRRLGIAGCVAMCILSQSRAGWVVFVCLIPLLFFADKAREPWFLITAGLGLTTLLVFSQPLYETLTDFHQQMKEARPASTRVRATLERLAVQRWESEAYWFGHGIVERGPKIVEGMPIGTHHTWYGLLFVKGLAGLLAFLVPMLITFIYLFFQALYYPLGRVAFNLVVVLMCYSLFENLEILTYVFWPALLIIGAALNPMKIGEEHGLKSTV